MERNVAEDALHDVFVSFAQTVYKFRFNGSLKGYLTICIANRARDMNRALRRRSSTRLDNAQRILRNTERPEHAVHCPHGSGWRPRPWLRPAHDAPGFRWSNCPATSVRGRMHSLQQGSPQGICPDVNCMVNLSDPGSHTRSVVPGKVTRNDDLSAQ